MRELFADLERLSPTVSRVAMATLVATSGAAPRKHGAHMLVGEGGTILGSVTIGGCVDARVIEEAERCLADGAPRLIELTLGDEDAWATGLSCGGTVEVLVEPLCLDRVAEWPLRGFVSVRSHLARGGRAAIVSCIDPVRAGRKLVVLEPGSVEGSLGDDALDEAATGQARVAIASSRSQTVRLERARVFIEVVTPPDVLVVVGATHLAMALSDLSRVVGFSTVVIDGRPRFATAARFPGVDLRVGIPSELLRSLPLTRLTALVLAAHDYKYDLPVLRYALTTDVGYVGMLGSRRRGDALKELLRGEGVSEQRLSRVRVPVGLDLGGSTVPEIALAILSEITAAFRRGSGRSLSERSVPALGG